ncbi:MAG: Mu transposase C-terminal domain-containing protein [Notoacmeibacter sp.]|nr:Mu transposase C-terminal domain-containing protein [Notoacmeibacter sp.]
MREWFAPAEIARAAGRDLPASERGITRLAKTQGWNARKRQGGRGGGTEYHVSSLPGPVQVRLSMAFPSSAPAAEKAEELWQRFEALPAKHKRTAEQRLAVLATVERYRAGGLSVTAAIARAAGEAGVSAASVHNWRKLIHGVKRADWLAALAPGYGGTGARGDCHEQAYATLKSDFLRPERPAFSACYRRMKKLAEQNGWTPIPSERALRRHLDADVPKAVQKLARDGRDTAKALYPAQTRSVAHLHAMQYVNIDGHKFDVFVRRGDRVFRPCIVAIQDIYSRKFVGWRLAETEDRHATRLAIGDVVERFGIPDALYSDNGRAFTSKWISGGAANRYRFKVKDEDPVGILTALGIEVRWTTPYSGQSKPIERAFRDFAENIARHPACAGAYTGNRPDAKPENYGERAVAWDTFAALVECEIAEHNSRSKRNTETAQGRSFDETFEASYAEAIVRRATAAQRSLWLMAAERIRTSKGNGEIHFAGNRYWAPELTAHAGKHVTVRFDPDHLKAGISVYDATDRLIARAGCFDATGFDDMQESKAHAKNRNAYTRAIREQQRLHTTLSADELARLHGELPAPVPQEPASPKVTRLATAAAQAVEQDDRAEWDEQAEESFSRALRLIAGGQAGM